MLVDVIALGIARFNLMTASIAVIRRGDNVEPEEKRPNVNMLEVSGMLKSNSDIANYLGSSLVMIWILAWAGRFLKAHCKNTYYKHFISLQRTPNLKRYSRSE